MAVDTKNKRYSAIHVGCPWRSSLPIPDGTVDQGDRQHVAGFYRGVLAAAAADADGHLCGTVSALERLLGEANVRQRMTGTVDVSERLAGEVQVNRC